MRSFIPIEKFQNKNNQLEKLEKLQKFSNWQFLLNNFRKKENHNLQRIFDRFLNWELIKPHFNIKGENGNPRIPKTGKIIKRIIK